MRLTSTVVDGTAAPGYISQGLGYDDGSLAVDFVNAIDHYLSGLPFTADGRLCVEKTTPTRIDQGIPFADSGRLAVVAQDDGFGWWELESDLEGVGDIPVTLTRADQKIYPNLSDDYIYYPANTPAFGVGLSVEGASTNKLVIFNDGSATTNIAGTATTTQLALSAVPEPYQTQIRNKLGHLFDDGTLSGVFKSTATGAQVMTASGATGNTNKHSLSVFAVLDGTNPGGGSNVLRLNTPVTPNTDIPETFDRVKLEDVTPGATNAFLQLAITDRSVYWVLADMEEATTCSSPKICLGATGARADDDAQLPMFADQYLRSTDISNATYWTPTAASVSGNDLTLTATASSWILSLLPDITVGGAYYIHAKVSSSDVPSMQLQYFAVNTPNTNVISGDLGIGASPSWVSLAVPTVVGDTNPRMYLRNNTSADAGTITVHEVQVTTSPIPTKTLATNGTAKVWEMGNQVLSSEDLSGTGWTLSNATITGTTAIAPDGRTINNELDDSSVVANGHSEALFTVADDTATHTIYFEIEKVASITNYAGVAINMTGGTVINTFVVVNQETGEVSAVNGTGTATALGATKNGFWRYKFSQANNGTGNTAFRIRCYPALNTDGSSNANVTTTGTARFWGVHFPQQDVDNPDQYCPTWGSARKLKYNQVWENRVWIYGELPRGLESNGSNQVLLDSYIDASNYTRILYVDATGVLRAVKRVGGVSNNADTSSLPDDTAVSVLLVLDDSTGVTLSATGLTDGTNANADDAQQGSTMQLGNINDGALNFPLFAELSNLKWGILPAGGITLAEAKTYTGIDHISNGLPFTQDSQLVLNVIN